MSSPPTPPLCGISGWNHPDWSTFVFPQVRPRGFHPLSFLSGYFDLFEVDASRENLRPEISRLWLKKAGPRPVFTVVLGHRFTQERDLSSEAVASCKEGLWPFLNAGRLGCLLLEFPWPFRFTRENRDFLISLRRAFHEFPLAAEMRHASWMLDEALGTLMDYRIGFCNVDQPEWLRAMPPAAIVTSSTGYVRLHGRAAEYLYTPEELETWHARVDRIAKHTLATFVITANAAGARSVVNALELRLLIEGSPANVPCELTRHYPDRLNEMRKPLTAFAEQRLRMCG